MSEIGEGGGFAFERRDGLDEAGDGQGVAHTAGSANEPKGAAFAGKPDGNAHQCGDAGAVDLRNVVEKHNNLFRALEDQGVEDGVELFGRFADGETAVDVQNGNAVGLAGSDFQREVVGHFHGPVTSLCIGGQGAARPARHYTMANAENKNRNGSNALVTGEAEVSHRRITVRRRFHFCGEIAFLWRCTD